jgi:hypothetical protein
VKRLHAEDIEVGMFITAGQLREEREVASPFSADTLTRTFVDNSYTGDVYKVVCIDRPYMVIKCFIDRGGYTPKPGTFDDRARSVPLHDGRPWYKVSHAYIKALTGNK